MTVPAQDYVYEAEVVAWIDGDTVALHVTKDYDFGFYISVSGHFEGHFRLIGVDTPERGHLNFREATTAARQMAPVGSKVFIRTEKTDKYGRYLADIVTPAGLNISNELIALGLGKPYGTSGEISTWAGPAAIGLAQPIT